MHYYEPYRITIGIFFTVILLFVLAQNMTPIWKQCRGKFYFINLSIHQDPMNNWRVPFKNIKFCALLAWTAAFKQSDLTEKCYSTAH